VTGDVVRARGLGEDELVLRPDPKRRERRAGRSYIDHHLYFGSKISNRLFVLELPVGTAM
jgi:hypothetical protein